MFHPNEKPGADATGPGDAVSAGERNGVHFSHSENRRPGFTADEMDRAQCEASQDPALLRRLLRAKHRMDAASEEANSAARFWMRCGQSGRAGLRQRDRRQDHETRRPRGECPVIRLANFCSRSRVALNSVQPTPAPPPIPTVGGPTHDRRCGNPKTGRHDALQRNVDEGHERTCPPKNIVSVHATTSVAKEIAIEAHPALRPAVRPCAGHQ